MLLFFLFLSYFLCCRNLHALQKTTFPRLASLNTVRRRLKYQLKDSGDETSLLEELGVMEDNPIAS
jgi:hypothetical protein